jgi:hypothetical protein
MQHLTVTLAVLCALLGLIVADNLIAGPPATAAAQEESPADFAALLARIETETITNLNFTAFIRLAAPTAADDTLIGLGAGQGWTIREIGSDYVCVQQISGQFASVRCYPFSSIAGISFNVRES